MSYSTDLNAFWASRLQKVNDNWNNYLNNANQVFGTVNTKTTSTKTTTGGNTVKVTTGALNNIAGNITAKVYSTYTPTIRTGNQYVNKVNTSTGSGINTIVKTIDPLDKFTQDRLNDIMNDRAKVLSTITDLPGGTVKKAKKTVDDIGDKANDGWLSTIQNAVDNLWTQYDNIVGAVNDQTAFNDKIGTTINLAIHNALAQNNDDLLSGIGGPLGDALDNVGRWIQDRIAELGNTLREIWIKVVTFVLGLLKRASEAAQWIIDQIEAAITPHINALGKWIRARLDYAFEELSKAGANSDKVWEQWATGNISSLDGLITALTGDGFGGQLLRTLLDILTAVVAPLSMATAGSQPIRELVVQHYTAQIMPTLIPVNNAIEAMRGGIIPYAEFLNELKTHGLNPHRIDVVTETTRPLLGPNELRELYQRRIIERRDVDAYLLRLGYRDEDIARIKALFPVLPNAADLVRMSVREVFNEDIANRFGQYQDYPSEFGYWMERLGFDEDWARRYWAAHWELPSVTMGFDMLHRRIIGQDDLRLLLRALDVMPYWRDKLTQLSYNPLTRVDVRRMYGLGVLDRGGVKDAYLDLGYDDHNAELMTEFTIRYETRNEGTDGDYIRQLTRSVYMAAYRRGLMDYETALNSLLAIGYVDQDARLLLELEDYNKELIANEEDEKAVQKELVRLTQESYERRLIDRDSSLQILLEAGLSENYANFRLDIQDRERTVKLKGLVADAIRELYVQFTIDNTTVYSLLGEYGFNPDEVNAMVEEMNIARLLRTRMPTLADFKRFLRNGIIELDDFVDGLKGLGYHDKYIAMYLADELPG